jgi:PAS domain S-box-containing protein
MKTMKNMLENYKEIIRSDFFLEGPVIAFIWNNDTTWSVETVSQNIEKHLGYEDKLFLRNVLLYSSLIHPDDLVRVVKEVTEASINKLKSFNHEPYRILDANDRYIWVKDSTNILYDEDENITHFVGYIISINDEMEKREQYQRKLEEQKTELQTIFDTTKDGIAVLDMETNFKKVNKAYCVITGLSEEELLSTSCFALTYPEDIPNTQAQLKILLEQGFVDSYEKRCLLNGKVLAVNISVNLLPDGKHMLLSMKDVSKFKTFEAQSKLASMGEMIGNIAHQWRQPLSVIAATSSGISLREEMGMLDKNILLEGMDNILHQATYLSKTIDDFRNFIKDTHEQETLSIKATLQKTISIIHPAMKSHNIQLIVDIADDLEISGYENELIQSFINIINNGRDAITENVESDVDKLIFITTVALQEGLNVIIKDSGGGVPQNVMEKIFEPYFTTKHQSVGTGIGLSMTYKILTEHHNGTIDVHNEKYEYNGKNYKGACFSIQFPFSFKK